MRTNSEKSEKGGRTNKEDTQNCLFVSFLLELHPFYSETKEDTKMIKN